MAGKGGKRVSEQKLSSRQVSIGTAATALGEGLVSGSEFHLYATASGNQTVFLGNGSVTTSNGFQLHKDTHVTIRIPERVQLYAVADNAGAIVTVLQVGGI
jgi:hypothetical protein